MNDRVFVVFPITIQLSRFCQSSGFYYTHSLSACQGPQEMKSPMSFSLPRHRPPAYFTGQSLSLFCFYRSAPLRATPSLPYWLAYYIHFAFFVKTFSRPISKLVFRLSLSQPAPRITPQGRLLYPPTTTCQGFYKYPIIFSPCSSLSTFISPQNHEIDARHHFTNTMYKSILPPIQWIMLNAIRGWNTPVQSKSAQIVGLAYSSRYLPGRNHW